MRYLGLGYGKIAAVVGIGLAAACTGTVGHGFGTGTSAGDGNGTPTSPAVPELGGSATLGPSGGVVECYVPGAKAACWTGPIADRNRGACHDGVQECLLGGGEVAQAKWTECTGQVLDCGSAPPPVPDAGPPPAPDAAPPPPPPPGVQVCENPSQGSCCDTCTGCVPGAVVFCYDSCIGPPEYCREDVQQTCQPDGTWGACTETGASFNPSTDCIHFWDGCDLNGGAGSYAGNCDAALKCSTPFSAACPGQGGGVGDFGAGTPLPPEP